MGYSNKYPHEIMSSKKHKKGSLVKKIASFLAVFFILMSVGYGVGIVPESWIDAIEYIASPLDGPQGLWKGDKNTGDTQTSSQDNAAVQGTRTQVSGTLNVEFIDVGQADAILIYNDENAMLIDAGNNPDGKPLTNYIKSLGIDHLDYVIGTHNHEDHIGGMDDVITAYSSEVDYIMLSEEEGTTATYRSVVEAADSSSAEQLTPKAGETYTLGDATWQILSCDTDMPDLNESSIVIKLTYGNTSFLFTGDATMNTEQGLEMSGYDLKSDVLKVGHHGSAGSTADSFLDAVAPEIAVISVDSESDMGEMYHHRQPQPCSVSASTASRSTARTNLEPFALPATAKSSLFRHLQQVRMEPENPHSFTLEFLLTIKLLCGIITS